MSTYDKLSAVLKTRPTQAWKVAFAELERLIEVKLPASAFKYPGWWSNNPSNNSMTKIWLKAGWRTEQVDIAGQTVVFRRAETARTGFGDRPRDFEFASLARAPEIKAFLPIASDGAAREEAKAVGRALTAARERAGLNAAELANRTGFSHEAIRAMESGLAVEAWVRLAAIAAALGSSPDELLGFNAETSKGECDLMQREEGDHNPQFTVVRKVRFEDLHGCMKGTLKIMPGVDITEPLTEEWEANEAKWNARFADPEFGLQSLSPAPDKRKR